HDLHPLLLIHAGLESEFPELHDGPFDSVLVGDAENAFTYSRLNEAFRLLLEGAPLLAMGNNRFFKEADGFSLDVGAFVRALEFAAGIEATVLGKPAWEFFRAVLDSLDRNPGDAVMVGDDAVADVGGAMDAGLQGVLVQTGKYRQGDELQIGHDKAKVVPDLPAAVEWILQNSSTSR
ncbi:MAG: HAD hydrolase-like protein, partial [Gammaproteobacteria bacterium]